MGIEADLASELKAMLASEASDIALATWLRKNAEVVHECLDVMDDMVTVPEIDLQDMVAWAKERDMLMPVSAAPRPR